MLDWSSIFNIAFVSAMGALIVFLLVSAIVVAAKGKRRFNAFDIILRIISALVFMAATAMLASVVLSMLDGKYCIVLTPAAESVNPAAALVFGEKVIELPFPELFLALSSTIGSDLAAVLFVCALAALIVDCVVANKKKPSAAAQKSAEQLKREKELEKIKKIGDSAVQKTKAAADTDKKPEKASDDGASQSDWRAEKSEPAEFVGVKKSAPSDFDTFDDVEAPESNAVHDVRTTEFAEFDAKLDEVLNGDTATEAQSEQFDEAVEPDAETEPEPESLVLDEQAPADEDATENEHDELENAEEEAAEPKEEPVIDADENVEDSDADATEPETEPESERDEEEAISGEKTAEVELDDESDDGVAIDRDIYILGMRTITRTTERPAAAKPASAVKKATVATTKPAAAKSGAAKTGKGKTPDAKKLPVNRRYVILDRRNAVNMFGEYLKERDRAAKDKLQSSINTIIIE